MATTIITNRVLITDHSLWDYVIKPLELIDGGVTDVILKAGSGLKIDPRFLKHGEAVARYSNLLRLHAYWWDDPLVSANAQADFAAKLLKKSGLPILSLWGDQEQWWGDWGKWLAARQGKLAWGDVPVMKPWALDNHYHSFAEARERVWPAGGLYTARGFITTYAPGMSKWLGGYKIWIAAYGRQPKIAMKMTWQELRQYWLPDYDPIIRETGISRDNLVGHQFTGDKCMLPGSYQDAFGIRRKPMDVNVFSRKYIESLATPLDVLPGAPIEEPPAQTGNDYIFLGDHLWVRNTPSNNAKLVDSLTKSQRVTVLEIIDTWARIEKPAGWVRESWLTKL